MGKAIPRRRPGGRSARIRDEVHRVAVELLAEGPNALTVANIADRSGVHQATIYRRWANAEAILLEAAAAQLEHGSPIPDTGTLRGDLLAYAARVAGVVAAPGGNLFFRAVLATAEHDGRTGRAALPLLERRAQQIQTMLDRARARSEPSLHYSEVLDDLLAPMYVRAVFGLGAVSKPWLRARVDRLLARPTDRARR